MSPIYLSWRFWPVLVALYQLGVKSFSEIWNIWGEVPERPFPGQIKYHLLASKLLGPVLQCRHHIGMSDSFRFPVCEKASSDGTNSLPECNVGHYMAWIAQHYLYAGLIYGLRGFRLS